MAVSVGRGVQIPTFIAETCGILSVLETLQVVFIILLAVKLPYLL